MLAFFISKKDLNNDPTGIHPSHRRPLVQTPSDEASQVASLEYQAGIGTRT